MARQRSFFSESPSWSNPSEIFSDTQRVDLFNDPKWETPLPSARRAEDDESPRASRWRVRRVLMRRGQHSRKVA
jgi:hypothetical protein